MNMIELEKRKFRWRLILDDAGKRKWEAGLELASHGKVDHPRGLELRLSGPLTDARQWPPTYWHASIGPTGGKNL
jgi:hypothetical protein